MGNAESGPEISLNNSRGNNNLTINTNGKSSPKVYHQNVQTAFPEEDVRQPAGQSRFSVGMQRDKYEAAMSPTGASNMAIASPMMSQNRASTTAAAPSVTFHPVPSPVFSPSRNQSSYRYQIQEVGTNNSILQSRSDLDEDSEGARLLKNIDSLGVDVVEATAAVYHYLETNSTDDEMSVSGRCKVVLQYIQQEIGRGNTQPAYKFLETSKAVSEILQEEEDENNHGDQVLPTLAQLLKEQDDRSLSGQSAAIFRLLDEVGSQAGGGGVLSLES